jgi:hypothetical protein
MSERSELEKRGAELAEGLGFEFESKGLSNKRLAGQIEALEQRKVEQDEANRQAERAEEHRAAYVERINTAANEFRGHGLKYAYQVAPGKQLQCRIGLLKSGAQVKREWVGGIDELDKLVDADSVLRGPLAKRFEVVGGHQLEKTTHGILSAGDRVEPEYVGGERKLEALIREGHVKRNDIPPER